MNTYKINEIRQHQYLQLPKELLYSEKYKGLSCESKMIYSLLLDRMELSRVNNWVNEKNEIYLIFARSEIMELLQISDKTCTKAFKQLTEVELIREVRQRGMPNLIFIGHIEIEKKFRNRKNSESEIVEIPNQDSEFLRPNNTDINNTNNISINQSNINIKHENKIDYDINGWIDRLKKQIDYDYLIFDFFVDNFDINLLKQIFEIILDVFTTSANTYFKINGDNKPLTVVKGIFAKLTRTEIISVIYKLGDQSKPIKNPRSYIISSLYNSVMTSLF